MYFKWSIGKILNVLYFLKKWVVNCFPNGLGYHMPCRTLDGAWKTGTHSRVHDGCHMSIFPSPGVTLDGCEDQKVCGKLTKSAPDPDELPKDSKL